MLRRLLVGACLLRQVVGGLDVDVVGRDRFHRR
jgi:hypothetical protein